jgi:hypothetical protein
MPTPIRVADGDFEPEQKASGGFVASADDFLDEMNMSPVDRERFARVNAAAIGNAPVLPSIIERPKMSAADSALHGVVDGVTFGFADELAGLALDRGARDQWRRRTAVAQEDHGGAYLGGSVAGGLATIPLTGGGGGLYRAAAEGALYGAGSGDADSVGGRLGDALKGAAIGAGTAGALQLAAKGAGKAVDKIRSVADGAQGRIDKRAISELIRGATPKERLQILADEQGFKEFAKDVGATGAKSGKDLAEIGASAKATASEAAPGMTAKGALAFTAGKSTTKTKAKLAQRQDAAMSILDEFDLVKTTSDPVANRVAVGDAVEKVGKQIGEVVDEISAEAGQLPVRKAVESLAKLREELIENPATRAQGESVLKLSQDVWESWAKSKKPTVEIRKVRDFITSVQKEGSFGAMDPGASSILKRKIASTLQGTLDDHVAAASARSPKVAELSDKWAQLRSKYSVLKDLEDTAKRREATAKFKVEKPPSTETPANVRRAELIESIGKRRAARELTREGSGKIVQQLQKGVDLFNQRGSVGGALNIVAAAPNVVDAGLVKLATWLKSAKYKPSSSEIMQKAREYDVAPRLFGRLGVAVESAR